MQKPQIPQPQNDTPESNYNRILEDLILNKGFTPRRARRYLEAYAKRKNAEFIKAGKARQAKLKAEGKLIDTSGVADELDKELQDELKKAGITLSDDV